MAKLILASASPRRREILALTGLPFEVRAGSGEENTEAKEPEEMVRELSMRKAKEALSSAETGDVIIGADTVVALDGSILGKPENEEEAFSMLKQIQGRSHEVYTGVTVIRKESGERAEGPETVMEGTKETVTFSERTVVHVCSMNDKEILEYIKTGEPMDKAGAYGIQGCFAVYVQGIEGDYQNVVGLPLSRLYGYLKTYRGELE
ncbi:MAG: septum formation protein Maf [Lachnospiraceae bacterium]|nr:septum formation protein Maf [Lachnospiraceae bacterium]